jgi:acetyltransferase-like isoleucine patch superfamily enzyme
MDWLSEKELVGFKSIGENVLISRHAVIYGRENIEIGDHVRIDAFCLIMAASGCLSIGKRVHIAARTTLQCAGGVNIGDYAQIATGCSIISASDSFSGDYLVGPMIPEVHRHVLNGPVDICIGAVVGAHSVLLPFSTIEKGAALGAMSMVTASHPVKRNTLYFGVPAKYKGDRGTMWMSRIDMIESDTRKSLDSGHILDIDRDLPKKD